MRSLSEALTSVPLPTASTSRLKPRHISSSGLFFIVSARPHVYNFVTLVPGTNSTGRGARRRRPPARALLWRAAPAARQTSPALAAATPWPPGPRVVADSVDDHCDDPTIPENEPAVLSPRFKSCIYLQIFGFPFAVSAGSRYYDFWIPKEPYFSMRSIFHALFDILERESFLSLSKLSSTFNRGIFDGLRHVGCCAFRHSSQLNIADLLQLRNCALCRPVDVPNPCKHSIPTMLAYMPIAHNPMLAMKKHGKPHFFVKNLNNRISPPISPPLGQMSFLSKTHPCGGGGFLVYLGIRWPTRLWTWSPLGSPWCVRGSCASRKNRSRSKIQSSAMSCRMSACPDAFFSQR